MILIIYEIVNSKIRLNRSMSGSTDVELIKLTRGRKSKPERQMTNLYPSPFLPISGIPSFAQDRSFLYLPHLHFQTSFRSLIDTDLPQILHTHLNEHSHATSLLFSNLSYLSVSIILKNIFLFFVLSFPDLLSRSVFFSGSVNREWERDLIKNRTSEI